MKPFSTPVLAKRTYRELKLLKHLRHENVGGPLVTVYDGPRSMRSKNTPANLAAQIISLSDIFISPLEDM
jgi:p38 MAP kinase